MDLDDGVGLEASRLSDRPPAPIKVVVMHGARISFGHALLQVGLLVRKVSTALAAVLTVVLVLGFFATAGGLDREVEAHLGKGAAAVQGGGGWRGLGTLAVVLIGGRVIVAATIAALGWFVLPPEHRLRLSEAADRARGLR